MTDLSGLITVLARHEVEFIIVGGVAAVLRGAPINTFDLDIVHARTPQNIARLLEALEEIDAEFRHHPSRIAPNATHLESKGHQLLRTKLGSLDVLGTIDDGAGYDELLRHCDVMEIAGLDVRVLHLRSLIEIKRRAGRPKDLVAVPILEHAAAISGSEEQE